MGMRYLPLRKEHRDYDFHRSIHKRTLCALICIGLEVNAQYDKDKNECFTDIALFREYVSKYGRSCLSPKFEHKESGGNKNFDELNATSILKEYGYSVSKKDGLTTHERQELLAEIVDLEILSVESVVQLLVFFIRTHSNDSYWSNRIKWEMDKKYIQEYMVNPQRFLIAPY